jgi:mRNA-degrading endonuclease toxin of MazEF toxin-antitoxin module
MKSWDIFSWQAPGCPQPHPAVILSHPDRAANKPEVTVLVCASRRTTRQPEPNEVILDANYGLDWPTLCKCDLLYTIHKANRVHRRGTVGGQRRRQIIATINRVNGWV